MLTPSRTSGDTRRRCARRGLLAVAACIAAVTACAPNEPVRAGALVVDVDTMRTVDSAVVIIRGLSTRELSGWARRPAADPLWPNAFWVSPADADSVRIEGRYFATRTELGFVPDIPFVRGRKYYVSYVPPILSTLRRDPPSRDSIEFPRIERADTTHVVRVYPTREWVPENLQRMYVDFSAPMAPGSPLPAIHLISELSADVKSAFVATGSAGWNADRTRYTIVLDPGRVEFGIRSGRALINGRRYRLRIDSSLTDARGLPLKSTFEQQIRVGPREILPIKLSHWRLTVPRSGTRDPFVAWFPKSMDHDLLRRALSIESGSGTRVEGAVTIPGGEREWHFVPSQPWRAGAHRVIIQSILEDLAGNRINRRSAPDVLRRVDTTTVLPRYTLSFDVP